MKIMIYAMLIAAALLVPTQPQELGKLKAVEVIKVSQIGKEILIETDTEDFGIGETVDEALQDLKETAPGTVYLDTAQYLLVPRENAVWSKRTFDYLKGTVRICSYEGNMDLKQAANYLRTHQPRMRVKGYQDGAKLQILVSENGRMNLEEKMKNSEKDA